MPKQKKKYVPKREATASTEPAGAKRWVRIAAITVIVALLFSVMLAAISSTPSKAATPTPSATTCAPRDTDGDGIINNNDPDIDGDGIVNGKDADIDGDGIPNAQDPDPASTNCEKSTTPPVLNNDLTVDGKQVSTGFAWQWALGILAIAFGYLSLRRARRRK